MNTQLGKTPSHLRPWSVVDDEELALLREIARTVSYEGGVSATVHMLLGRLREARGIRRPHGPVHGK